MGRILITGGCGFIGTNLSRRLSKAGHEIRILDNQSSGHEHHLQDVKNVSVIIGDVRDSNALERAAEGMQVAIHLAASGSVVESVKDPMLNFDNNARGTLMVLEACRKQGVQRLVFASTGGALMGHAVPPVDERSVPRPISPYGASKLCGEAYCSSYAEAYRLQVTALRFANVFGPYSGHKKGAVTAFMKAVHSGRPIKIYGDGSATRDFLYVDDLCDGIMKVVLKDLQGYQIMHLVSGVEVTVRQLLKAILEVADRGDQKVDYLPPRTGEVDRNCANYERAKLSIDFEPKTSLQDGL